MNKLTRGSAAAAALGVAAAGLALVGSNTSADAAPARPISCQVTIDYTAPNVASQYLRTFVLENGATYSDDRSTPLREEQLTASRNRNVITISYFKDVSTFDNIALNTKVVVGATQGQQAASNVFSDSAGNHGTTYSMTCTKL